jgi:hypothetical protein
MTGMDESSCSSAPVTGCRIGATPAHLAFGAREAREHLVLRCCVAEAHDETALFLVDIWSVLGATLGVAASSSSVPEIVRSRSIL